MKKTKKLLALLLALALMVTAFAACYGGTGEDTASDSSTGSAAADNGDDGETADDGTGHPMRIVQPGTLCEDYDTGIAAVNEKLLEDGVNIEVSMTRIPWDAYAEKLNLMLTTGEEFELLHVMQDVKNLSSIAGMGAIISIDELMEKYPDLYNKFTETEWLGTLYNGEKYAVPCYWRTFDNVMSYMTYRSDVAEAVGYDEFPETTEEIIDLMKKSQDYIVEETGAKAYSWMHQNQDTAHWLHRSYDTYPFYVENSLGIVLIRQDGTVDSFYESEEFKQDADTYYEMYQAGLIDPDILNRDSQKKYDDAKFGAMLPSQTFDPNQGVTMQENGVEGAEVKWVRSFSEDTPDMIYTYVQNLNAISATAEDPESGLKFLNWLYASEENHNLYHYGIEGTHYEVVEEGAITNGEDRINYPEGLDATTTTYRKSGTWLCPNQFIGDIWGLDLPDNYWDATRDFNNGSQKSAAFGFSFDATKTPNEIAACTNVVNKYHKALVCGALNPEETLPKFNQELKDAGIDAIITEKQAQLDAWLAEQA